MVLGKYITVPHVCSCGTHMHVRHQLRLVGRANQSPSISRGTLLCRLLHTCMAAMHAVWGAPCLAPSSIALHCMSATTITCTTNKYKQIPSFLQGFSLHNVRSHCCRDLSPRLHIPGAAAGASLHIVHGRSVALVQRFTHSQYSKLHRQEPFTDN